MLNYEEADLTSRLLQNCLVSTYPCFEIVVIDNGSADQSAQLIASRFPSITLIKNDTNLGYAAGANVGLRYAFAHDYDYVLLLNNDTIVAPDMLARLVAHAEQARASAVAPLICYEEAPEIIWSGGANQQTLTLDIKANRHGATYQSGKPYLVDYATACGLMISAETLKRVGLFDEQFFMYYEDLDWCWRHLAQNRRIVIVPNARMWHQGAATIGGYDSASERYHMALSSVLFFRKYTTGWRWLVVVPFRLLSGMKTSWRLLRKGNLQALRAYWRGVWHGINQLAGK